MTPVMSWDILCIILHARVPILIDLTKVQSENVLYKNSVPPSTELLKSAKKATKQHNDEHIKE